MTWSPVHSYFPKGMLGAEGAYEKILGGFLVDVCVSFCLSGRMEAAVG